MGNQCTGKSIGNIQKKQNEESVKRNQQFKKQNQKNQEEINQPTLVHQDSNKNKEKIESQIIEQQSYQQQMKEMNNRKEDTEQKKNSRNENENQQENNVKDQNSDIQIGKSQTDKLPNKQICEKFKSNLENEHTQEAEQQMNQLKNAQSSRQQQFSVQENMINQKNQKQQGIDILQIQQQENEKEKEKQQLQQSDNKQKMREEIEKLKKDVEKLKFGSLKHQHSTKLAQQIIKEEQQKLDENADHYFSEQDLKYYENLYKDEKVKKLKNKNNKIRWKEGQHLGSGSFGQVILGMNLDTGELMAIKQINRRDIPCTNEEEKKEMIEALELEIELYKGLSHPNIVQYMGTTKSKETLNIFLEYVAQGSISYLLQKYQQFNEQLAKVYMQKILLGLEYLHSHKVVHRDIKGANVLVDNEGICKLAGNIIYSDLVIFNLISKKLKKLLYLDFGSCKRIYNTPKEGQLEQIKGTVNWMAPEVIKQQNVGRFSDIWSIGCTLLEMLTGKMPYHQYKNPIIAMYQIGKGENPPEIPENLSSDVKDFLNQCFQFVPEKRPNVRQLLKHPYIVGNKNKPSNISFFDKPKLSGQFLNKFFKQGFPKRFKQCITKQKQNYIDKQKGYRGKQGFLLKDYEKKQYGCQFIKK
ncbi:Protein kinase-like domain [Pseudocohnilembus persalinus]|uniref:Protein kinase-like domain n=1 Tax=Pseudocohnilembus persalinus TaxID=266149 RepID=A0A0V0QG28_PSEPJ|nr:Protein kinase-like domain [Pseudocohnilembus persalinus]|eukprot:KRX01163.1 Protein kinase-like domain [Pseudocohnilembus persalinus]